MQTTGKTLSGPYQEFLLKNKVFERPLSFENAGRGFPNFASLTKLTEGRYIVDDTIVIQVQVAPE